MASLERLEKREVFALSGVTLSQLPLAAYDNSGVLTYDTATGSLDISATPLNVRFPPNSLRVVTGGHGDFQIHAKVDAAGNLIRGVNAGDTALNGTINANGDDLVVMGGVDLDGNGTIDPGETGVLLTGEIYAFGHLDSGGPTDRFDFRFIPTGGLLLPYYPAGRDVGVVMTSESSTFTGSFGENFTGGAKGNYGPIAPPAPSSLSGTVYCDRDQSGSLTSGDMGIANVPVRLTGTNNAGQPVDITINTNPDGTYSFPNLRPGTYSISETSPAQTVEGTNTVGTAGGAVLNEDAIGGISLLAGVDGVNYNFGYICLGNIVGHKFLDLTGDGLTSDDTPLAGTTIYIDANDNGQLDSGELSQVTGADGSFAFNNLIPGTYIIREVVSSGYIRTNPLGADNFTVNLAPGETNQGNDFSNLQLVSISGKKFLDITGNGITNDDTALGGTTIYLDLNNNGQLDSGEQSVVTAADGTYEFTGLLPGSYTVREVVPAGYNQTAPAPTNYYSIVLNSGQNATARNFANAQRKGSISGQKFLDITGNGLTADDTPLGGTTIYIDANNNRIKDSGERSTVTLADGSFTFSNLQSGTYIIREVVPEGYIRTNPTLQDFFSVTLGTGQSVSGLKFANAEKCDCNILTNVTYSINGTTVVTDLRGNTNQGDVVTVTFTVRPGAQPHPFTLVSYTAPGATFVAQDAAEQEIYDIDTGVFGPGTYTLTVTIPDSNYQIDFVCGEAIDRFGPAGSNIFYTPQCRLISADNDGCAVPLDNPSSLSGFVWLDDDNDGNFDADEMPIQGAKVTVSWTESGTTKSVSKYTDANGRYIVGNLRPRTYSVTETKPSGFADGRDVVGSAGGTLGSDKVTNIVLGAGVTATGYNFGERSANDQVGSGDTAALSFWKSSAGGNLIRSLNGGSVATQLGFWLADRFPNLFGASAGTMNLRGKSNSQIASAVVSRASSSSTLLEAEVLSTALSAYVTNSGWAGGTMATSYGFVVNLAGSGLSLTNVSGYGARLGFTNNTSRELIEILANTDDRTFLGMVYSGDSAARASLYTFFRAINAAGGIV